MILWKGAVHAASLDDECGSLQPDTQQLRDVPLLGDGAVKLTDLP